jgi:hypothetical protein
MLQRPKGPNASFTDDQIRKAKAYALEVNGSAFGMPVNSQNLLEKIKKTFRRHIIKTPQTVEPENRQN